MIARTRQVADFVNGIFCAARSTASPSITKNFVELQTMSQRAITRNQAAAADTNDAANLATITTTTIADAATATAGNSTAAPVQNNSAALSDLVGQIVTDKLAPFFALVQNLQTNVEAFTQAQQQQPPPPAPAAAPTPVNAVVRESKRESDTTLRQLAGTPFTDFGQKREQVQQLRVITNVITTMETETEGMDDDAALAYIKEGFSAIKGRSPPSPRKSTSTRQSP